MDVHGWMKVSAGVLAIMSSTCLNFNSVEAVLKEITLKGLKVHPHYTKEETEIHARSSKAQANSGSSLQLPCFSSIAAHYCSLALVTQDRPPGCALHILPCVVPGGMLGGGAVTATRAPAPGHYHSS